MADSFLSTKHVRLAARGWHASFIWPILACEFGMLDVHVEWKLLQ